MCKMHGFQSGNGHEAYQIGLVRMGNHHGVLYSFDTENIIK
jgi:hypothetical protein